MAFILKAPLDLSKYSDERDNRPKPWTCTWSALVNHFRTLYDAPPRGECTLAPGPNQCGTGDLDYDGKGSCCTKFGPAWSPARYAPGSTRSKHNVQAVNLLVLDFDGLGATESTGAADNPLDAILDRLEPFQHFWHTSHSHGGIGPSGKPEGAIRAVLNLSRPVLPAEWPVFWIKAIHHLDLGAWIDKVAKDASRLYFFPRYATDAEPLFDSNPTGPKGKVLDVDTLLATQIPGVGTQTHPTVMPLSNTPNSFGPADEATLLAAYHDILKIGPAIEGQAGDNRTFAVCARLQNNWALTEAEVWPLLRLWNATCIPPWDETELATKLANAKAYASDSFGDARQAHQYQIECDTIIFDALDGSPTVEDTTPTNQEGQPPFALEIAKAERELAIALGTSTASNKPQPIFAPAIDYLNKPVTPVHWLVRGLVIEGGVAAIIGEPKSTKSWLALDIALAVSSGTKALGEYQAPKPRKVAYFFAEDLQDAINARIRAYASGRGCEAKDLAVNLYIQPRGLSVDLSKDADCARIIASCRRLTDDLGLLILDPLRDIHTGSENESDSMSAVLKRIRLISAILKCTVLVVHHSKKVDPRSPATNGAEIRGSSVINAALDSRIILKDLDGDRQTTFDSTLEVVIKAGRGAGVQRISLTIQDDPETCQAIGATWQVKPEGVSRPESKDSDAESYAHSVLQALYKGELKNVVVTYDAARTTTKLTGTEFKLGRAHTIKQGWVVYKNGKMLLTESGRDLARLSLTRDNQEGES